MAKNKTKRTKHDIAGTFLFFLFCSDMNETTFSFQQGLHLFSVKANIKSCNHKQGILTHSSYLRNSSLPAQCFVGIHIYIRRWPMLPSGLQFLSAEQINYHNTIMLFSVRCVLPACCGSRIYSSYYAVRSSSNKSVAVWTILISVVLPQAASLKSVPTSLLWFFSSTCVQVILLRRGGESLPMNLKKMQNQAWSLILHQNSNFTKILKS